FGVLGLMATLRLGRIAGFSIIVSSGTLLAALGFGVVSVTSAALFYLLSATLAASALFLLVELIERASKGDSLPLRDVGLEPGEDTNLDDDETPLVGRAIPVSLALLGLAFIACALLVAGLPPLSGFIAKFSLMAALVSPEGLGVPNVPPPVAWGLFGLLLLSGLIVTVAMSKAGIRHFWTTTERPAPQVKAVEVAPVVALILACAWLTGQAEQVARYTTATAQALHSPTAYIEAVLSTKPVPGPTRPVIDREGTR
ncbi:MAG: proton-conducting transporter membrane subunit, partial [Gemmatimonadales bacterium]